MNLLVFKQKREWLVAVFLGLLIAMLVVVGRVFFEHEKQVYEQATQERLAGIVDMKVAQIAAWRRERWANASYLRHTPYVARRALDVLDQPASETTRQMFAAWLNSLYASGPFEQLLLLDGQLNVRLVYTYRASGVLSTAARGAAEQALSTREVVMTDLHRADEDGFVQLSIMVPLVVRREGSKDNVPAAGTRVSPADRSAGILVLQVNATKALFPIVESWPTPSPTAECLLVRREGGEVVYLNQVRHGPTNSALRLRLPLTNSWLPAARGIRGEKGAFVGRDYRDVSVLAVVKSVPGTPWFLVAKVDEEEVFAPFRAHAWTIGTLAGVLLLAASLAVAFYWKRRNLRFVVAQLASERANKVLAQRIAYLSQHANDIILLLDQDWRILEANDRALQAYGWSLADLRRLTLRDLHAPEQQLEFDRAIGQMDLRDGMVWETSHQRLDGTTFPVECSARTVQLEGRKYAQFILRDLTERKATEAERERMVAELHKALAEVKTLKGFIPICAACKKIRDDQGFWNQIESYIMQHSDAIFSHGICPDCAQKLYPNLADQPEPAQVSSSAAPPIRREASPPSAPTLGR